jgi:predicted nucleic acid-binding protein
VAAAYVDSSIVTAIAFSEHGHSELSARLARFDRLFSAPLLEAEVRSATTREAAHVDTEWFTALTWVLPERSLSTEIVRVLQTGYIRGADCWHLATALSIVPNPAELTFLTLDLRQREIAAALGFTT